MMPAPVEEAFAEHVRTEFDLLGCVLCDASVWPDVAHLSGGDFRDTLAGDLWETLRLAYQGGEPMEPTVLHARFSDDPRLPEYSATLIGDLIDHAPPPKAAAGLAQEVLARSMRQRVASVSRPGLALEEMLAGLREITDRAVTARTTKPIRPTLFEWPDPAAIQPRQWLYGRHLIRKFVSCTVAPGGVGKSSLIISEIMAMITGRGLVGEHVTAPLRVWYWNGEDPRDELDRRFAAARKWFRLTRADVGDRLMVDSGRDMELKLATTDGQGFHIDQAVLNQLESRIRDEGLDVVVMDPFIATHSVQENDNGAIDAIVKALGRVADRTGCAFELVHHVRKPGSNSTAETTTDDARGATALIGGVRSARVLNVMSEAEATSAGVDNRLQYFRVDNGKANLAPRSAVAKWRRLVGVDLGNGVGSDDSDEIGVVEAWELPGLFAGIAGGHLLAVQRAVAGAEWRADPQSQQWVGRAVASALAFDVEEPRIRKRIGEMLKVWIRNGVLTLVERKDAQRRPRKFVEVGAWAEAEGAED
jgi:hypothetical protein